METQSQRDGIGCQAQITGLRVVGHLMSGDEKEGGALVVKEQQPTNFPEALWCGALAWGIICKFAC